MSQTKQQQDDLNFDYKFGFSMPEKPVFKAQKGLNEDIVKQISAIKEEPAWMTEFRVKSYQIFLEKKMPEWGGDLSKIDFDNIYYYLKSTEKQVNSWEDLPAEIKETYDRIGVPEAEKKYLAGVSAQYECITGDSMVFTNHGAKQIKNIEKDTYVYSLNEQTKLLERQRVVGLAHKGVRPTYTLKTAGREIRCTQNHPLLALSYSKKTGKQRGEFTTAWRYLNDLSPGDYVAIVKNLPDKGIPFQLPDIVCQSTFKSKNQFTTFIATYNLLQHGKNKQLVMPKQTSDALMWLIGLYLGDGYISNSNKSREVLSIAIPATDIATRNKLQHVFKDVFHYKLREQKDKYRLRIHASPIIAFFKQLSLKGNARTKKLPEWTFSLPNSQKCALIAGYIDSDGYLRNDTKNSDVQITSVNKLLLQSFQLLAVSCGLHAGGIHQFTFHPNVKNNPDKTSVGFRLQLSGDLLPLTKHSIKVNAGFIPRAYYHSYNSHHKSPLDIHTSEHIGFAAIEKIEYAGDDDVYDIEVEGHHNFVANGIVVHNSEVVYESINKELDKLGVIFCDMDTALRKYPDIVKEYFGTLIPPHDNKFAALNSAVWSGGSFVYIPKNTHVKLPLQAYFRINSERFGQFERTLIIAEEGSSVHYVEGCTAPVYTSDSLHSAVVEIFVKKDARVRYTTVQNWSKNVYNLVTKRARADERAVMEWVDCNLGSQLTMKYPSVYLYGEGARGEVLSIAFAGEGQVQDAGAKMIHFAPNTSSRIVSKSISKDGGRTTYRGLIQVSPGATNSSVYVSCDALILDEKSRSDTYPSMKIKESDVEIQHEATVEKLGDEKLFYLMSRGLKKADAESALVLGFMEPVTKEIPLEYSIELNRLIRLEMTGSVG